MAEGTCPDCGDELQSLNEMPQGGYEFDCSICGYRDTISKRVVERAVSNRTAEGDEYV